MYNYQEEMKNSVCEWIRDNMTAKDIAEHGDVDGLREWLNDELWADDSVTGNGSGSYTMNRAQSKDNVVDNFPLLLEACREFCVDFKEFGEKMYSENWEWADVTIRCHLLWSAIDAALEELESEISEAFAEKRNFD